jgi:hypothetical protein
MADETNPIASLSAAGWIALVILLGLLAMAVWYAVWVWTTMQGVPISVAGWIFMSLGVVVTLALGVGLMLLVFYSSRRNFDQ